MKTIIAVAAAILLGLNGPLLAQDPMIEAGQTMNAIFNDGKPNPPPPSVTETLSAGWTEAVGNDYVEGVLLQGVEKLGAPEVALVPVADGSQVLGHVWEGQYADAAEKAVPTVYGSLFCWATAWLVGETLLEGAAVTVTAASAEIWVPALVAGATVGWVTKQAADWMIHPPSNKPPPPVIRPPHMNNNPWMPPHRDMPPHHH